MKYMIAVDFECTAFPTDAQLSRGWFREITEIGAVVFDVTGDFIGHDFGLCIRPTRFPVLSERYQREFGVTQRMLIGRRTLDAALQMFNKWIYGQQKLHNFVLVDSLDDRPWNAGYICTWSGADLSDILPRETSKKHLKYQEYLKYFVDIQKLYMDNFGGLEYGLYDAVRGLGDAVVGKISPARRDAYALANVAQHLWQRNIRCSAVDSVL